MSFVCSKSQGLSKSRRAFMRRMSFAVSRISERKREAENACYNATREYARQP
eukprot:UN11997